MPLIDLESALSMKKTKKKSLLSCLRLNVFKLSKNTNGQNAIKNGNTAVPNEEREAIVGDYRLIKVLGEGSFGKVFLAARKSKSREMLVAIKLLDKVEMARRKQISHTLSERLVMTEYSDHPFILSLRSSFQTHDVLGLVSDFCVGGDLFFHLEKAGRFSEETARFYIAEASDALIHLHKHSVVYRDLKCENILLDAAGHIRLADFGLSRVNVGELQGATTVCGSIAYMPPEMIEKRRLGGRSRPSETYGYMSDWWTLGTLLYDMLVGRVPFYERDTIAMFERIVSNEPVEFPSKVELAPETKQFIKSLLQRKPSKRLCCSLKGGFDNLYNHPFFADIDWERLRKGELAPPIRTGSKLRRRYTGPDNTLVESDSLKNFDPSFTDLDVTTVLQSVVRTPRVNPQKHEEINRRFKGWDQKQFTRRISNEVCAPVAV
mmetsp:Transcript_34637/g.55367  ORF Transcript_34637/g.55367 Transcript_34637/m.55367 type:complete len:434 (-) Transcript_34637:1679-2980(-)|eukprot:CAMPEP_0203784070 /NCGR_PEP_ID=MMETSP0100_2-20121128/260_1 /ASSEMBLY_ACC=CAM_ASM_000210 /TAXON_ID=96639 /ORGANISM=" , Strain NY0313808BC1" /LENGTH=433 /DNA_ID=CAMNT_0050686007 /DNA_START=253 /DNA_END=1554 /DNA_ORIENTATION=-